MESACKYGRAEMVKWLLEQGAIITFSVLSYAVQSGSIATVEVLVQHREYLMTEDLEKAFCQHPLLHRVVDANHPHLIEYMVKNGFDIDVRNSVGMTPLSWAANQYPESTRRKVVDKLLSLGANPNTKDNDGLTPLDLASYHDSNEEVCQFLKSHGGLLGKEIPN